MYKQALNPIRPGDLDSGKFWGKHFIVEKYSEIKIGCYWGSGGD